MTAKLDWKFYGYTKSKSQIACNKWQKSEISEKLKKDIILNLLFKWLKKPYESRFVKRKDFVMECPVKTLFPKQPLRSIAK